MCNPIGHTGVHANPGEHFLFYVFPSITAIAPPADKPAT